MTAACFVVKAFSGKKKNFWSWDYYPQVLIIRIYE
jgi:hypothetical protein